MKALYLTWAVPFVLGLPLLFFYLFASPNSLSSSLLYWSIQRKVKNYPLANDFAGKATSPSPIEFVPYQLVANDNLWNLSRKMGLKIDSIVSLNKFKNNHVIQAGTLIYLPSIDGLLATEIGKDPISRLSEKYNVSPDIILLFNPTNVLRPHPLGLSNFFLPGATYSPEERLAALGLAFFSPLTSTWITGLWGFRIHPLTKKRSFHKGIDLGGPIGTKVYAAMGGRVIFAGSTYAYGKMVIIRHKKNYETRYAHLSAIYVKSGQRLPLQATIGRLGQSGRVTGPHLHFEVRRRGKSIDPREVTAFRFKK